MPQVVTNDNTNPAIPNDGATNPNTNPPQQQQQQEQEQPPKPKKVPALCLTEHAYRYDPKAGMFPGMTNFVPQRFDPGKIKDDATMVFFGKRRTGKSFMCRYILWLKKKVYPFILVFTKTKYNGFWREHIPDRFIHKGYPQQILQRMIDKQEGIVQKITDGELEETRTPHNSDEVNPYKAVVFDDVISEGETFKRDKTIMSLFTEGRHMRIATFFCTQYAKGVSTVARGNCDLAFVFKQQQITQMESIAQDFMGMLPKQTAMEIITKFAQGYQCLVIDTSSLSTNPQDVIFTFQAEDPGPFRLGCKEFWEGNPVDANGAMQRYSRAAPSHRD